ncbi:MAG: tRNA (adenosine(37)-N6)-threonylcarbamoyltransferase complex ATPase subunit type 1 TsaE [Patescibacteria group bacterium]|mgnify:CR=1 FL=1
MKLETFSRRRRIKIIGGAHQKNFVADSDAATQNIAAEFALTLKGGEVIALYGDLGAGKTTFVKGLAKALGVTEVVTSPTFVLMNVYRAHSKQISRLVHIDCYRLERAGQLAEIGGDEYFGNSDTVVAIEWPERVNTVLPKDAIRIEFNLE